MSRSLRLTALVVASALLPWQAVAVPYSPAADACPLMRSAATCQMSCHLGPDPVQSRKREPAPSCHRVQPERNTSPACLLTRACSGHDSLIHGIPETMYLAPVALEIADQQEHSTTIPGVPERFVSSTCRPSSPPPKTLPAS